MFALTAQRATIDTARGCRCHDRDATRYVPAEVASLAKLLVTPEEAAELLGVGRARIYDLMRSHAIPSVKIGRSRRIPCDALRSYVEELAAASEYL